MTNEQDAFRNELLKRNGIPPAVGGVATEMAFKEAVDSLAEVE